MWAWYGIFSIMLVFALVSIIGIAFRNPLNNFVNKPDDE